MGTKGGQLLRQAGGLVLRQHEALPGQADGGPQQARPGQTAFPLPGLPQARHGAGNAHGRQALVVPDLVVGALLLPHAGMGRGRRRLPEIHE